MSTTKVFRCPECGLHYEDETVAKQCEAFCKEHNGCSLEITKLSMERTVIASAKKIHSTYKKDFDSLAKR